MKLKRLPTDARELELWRTVGVIASDHSAYCTCARCDERRELCEIVNRNSRRKP